MKGLIVKSKWADLILDGYKDIEIRGTNTKIRGTIGIIKSGTKRVYGTAELYDSVELDYKTFKELKERHKLNISFDELLKKYHNPHGWFLKNVNKYDNPIEYNHKQGCVIWVNI